VRLLVFVTTRLQHHLVDLQIMGCLVALLTVIERVLPAERGQSMRGRFRNAGFIVVFQLGGGILVSLLAYVLAPALLLSGEVLARRNAVERAGLVILYLFVSDLVFYWYHRAQHSRPALWWIHRLHHADSELNATSSLRTYLLERPIQFLLISMPIATLVDRTPGLEAIRLTAGEARALYLTALVWLFFAHANLRLELGRWSWIATAPQVHRIHHSIERHHQRKNYAQFFPALDVAFGTYWPPRPGEFPQTGIAERLTRSAQADTGSNL